MKEFYLDSCGGGRLHCAIWTPEGEPKAVVQLIHGIAEHIGRYDDFARFLNSHGYVSPRMTTWATAVRWKTA